MPFTYSQSWLNRGKIQNLLNAGLFYSLQIKATGEVYKSFHTLEAAKRAKTRKLRVVLTRNLLDQEIKLNETSFKS